MIQCRGGVFTPVGREREKRGRLTEPDGRGEQTTWSDAKRDGRPRRNLSECGERTVPGTRKEGREGTEAKGRMETTVPRCRGLRRGSGVLDGREERVHQELVDRQPLALVDEEVVGQEGPEGRVLRLRQGEISHPVHSSTSFFYST